MVGRTTRELANEVALHLDSRVYASFASDWLDNKARPTEFHRHLDDAVATVVIDELPPPVLTFERKDNSGALTCIILGGLVTIGGFTGFGTGAGWTLPTLAVGIVLLVLGFKGWTTDATYRRSISDATDRVFDEWERERLRLADELSDNLKERIHRLLGKRAGVPDRVLEQFVAESRAHIDALRKEWRVDWWTSLPVFPPAPGALAQRLGHDAYEEYCAQWMRSRGWQDAGATRFSRDGGIDIHTSMHAVQCKHYGDSGYVGAPAVREIFGVAQAENKIAVVITSGRFTTDARSFAERAGVALLVLDELSGTASAQNGAARAVVEGPETPAA